MRVKVINSRSDLEGLGAAAGQAQAARRIEQIQRLNPHLDVKNIKRGTVVLVPEAAGERDTEARSLQGDAFADLRSQVSAALDASRARVRRGYGTLNENAKEVTTVLKSAAVKRALEAQPDLKEQAEAATRVFKQDAADAKTAEQTLKEMGDRFEQELEALAKLLG
jgi:hypothetical protein